MLLPFYTCSVKPLSYRMIIMMILPKGIEKLLNRGQSLMKFQLKGFISELKVVT
jgi:hypothetical protein